MPMNNFNAAIAAFCEDIREHQPEQAANAAVALARILTSYAEVQDAVLMAVPAARFGRELCVTALCRNSRHLFDFMVVHCEFDETLREAGKGLARKVAALLDESSTSAIPPSDAAFRRRSTRAGGVADLAPIDYTVIDVFFATNRIPSAATHPYRKFGEKRGPLSYGRAEVTIPRAHDMGKLEEPKWWRLEFSSTPEKHVTVKSVTSSGDEEFFGDVGDLSEQNEGKILIFVHGFNIEFDEALKRTGQLVYDLNFSGASVLYSWPSNGELLDYFQDANNADWAKAQLEEFLTSLAIRTGARTIHLIAHSMGNRVLLNALDRLVTAAPQPRFAQMILTAPDVDVDIFKDLVGRCQAMATRCTLYASKTDVALAISRKINGLPRAGDSDGGLVVMSGLDTVDATDVNTSFVGHGYYGDNRSVLSDMYYTIRGLAPDARHGLRRIDTPPLPYWAFRS